MERLGLRPPRYAFMLNPHAELRLSRCPRCEKLTYPRKFPLLIQVEGADPLVLGKTCKYCSRCQLIICHQDELDAELAQAFAQRDPSVIGNEYVVLGTIDIATWKAGVAGDEPQNTRAIDQLADFKSYRSIDFDPGGWRHPDAPPERFIIKSADAEKRRVTPWTHPEK